MNQTIKVNGKKINVSFSNYYDSVLGEFLFRQVMCDVFMPGNEVVPIAMEKEQIRRIVDGFKKRKELRNLLSKENINGKACYVIPPHMRYDLAWLEGKKAKKPLSKDAEAKANDAVTPDSPKTQPEPKKPEYNDSRRSFLISKGFRHNEITNNWEAHGIRFPDAKIDNSPSDEEFMKGMNSLINADDRNRAHRNPKTK